VVALLGEEPGRGRDELLPPRAHPTMLPIVR
jgi:hypothetical protein